MGDVNFRQAVTGTAGAGGVAVSASSGNFSSASTSWIDVTNLTVTLTTTGRPVLLKLIPATGADGYFGVSGTGGAQSIIYWRWTRDGTVVGSFRTQVNGTDGASMFGPVDCLDTVAAGAHVYKLQLQSQGASFTASAARMRIMAYEL